MLIRRWLCQIDAFAKIHSPPCIASSTLQGLPDLIQLQSGLYSLAEYCLSLGLQHAACSTGKIALSLSSGLAATGYMLCLCAARRTIQDCNSAVME